ncbi:MAG: hypothetical protein AAF628_33735 [Planctomycetota bacterium]
MRSATTLTLALGLLGPALAAQSVPRNADGKLDLAVLVTGREDGTRRSAFATFLEQHFARVGVCDYTAFAPADADDFDVVVFDCEIRPAPGRIGLAKAPTLPPDFARASMLVAGGGAILADPLGLKTDWG